jgi:uncharacterized membrane protein
MTQRRFNTLYILVCVATLLPLLFPIFEVANRSTPLVLGIPFNFFWVILWIVLVFVGVGVLHAIDPQRKNDEGDR